VHDKVEAGRAQFDVMDLKKSLCSTPQIELANLFHSKCSPLATSDLDAENQRLNQIFVKLTLYLAELVRTIAPAPRLIVPPREVLFVTILASVAQANNYI
jgi:hypothetical protein